MKWDNLPDDVIKIIFYYRKIFTCKYPAATKIQSAWRCYRTRVLIGRFNMLHYFTEFRLWNPDIFEFLKRSKL